jgi:hypothetical protein
LITLETSMEGTRQRPLTSRYVLVIGDDVFYRGDPPLPPAKLTSSYQYIILKDGGKVLWLGAQYQSSSGHSTGNSSILVDPSSQITEPSVIFHPRLIVADKAFFLQHPRM